MSLAPSAEQQYPAGVRGWRSRIACSENLASPKPNAAAKWASFSNSHVCLWKGSGRGQRHFSDREKR